MINSNNNQEIKDVTKYSITKKNVVSDNKIIIIKDMDLNYSSTGAVTIWKLIEEGINNKIIDIFEYNTLKNDDFIYNNNFINADESNMQLKTNYSKPTVLREELENLYICSITVNLDNYREFEVI